MTSYCNLLSSYKEITPHPIRAANSEFFSSIGIGNMKLSFNIGLKISTIVLKNVLHCPNLHTTLISVSKIDEAGYSVNFANNECHIYNSQGSLIGFAPKKDGLYQICSTSNSAYLTTDKLMSLYEAYLCLGHVNYAYIKHLLKDPSIQGIKLNPNKMDELECNTCMKAKAKRQPIQTK